MSRIAVTTTLPDIALDRLRENHDVTVWQGARPPGAQDHHTFVAGVDAILSNVTDPIDGAALDAAGPQLKVVANYGVGYNSIDVAACHERGVTVTNTPGVLTDATADLALLLILAVTRRAIEGDQLIRRGDDWAWSWDFMLGHSIAGRTLGIVGMGAIGTATARRAKVFGMNLVHTKRTPLEPVLQDELGSRHVELPELLAVSDVVSLHCPYTKETHHLLGASEFAQLKRTAYVINTSRGKVVDEAALVDALRSGQIAGAGLDVFENEPEVHPGLLDLDNVVLLPHLGSATVETRVAMAQLAVDNVLAVLAGQPAPTEVRA